MHADHDEPLRSGQVGHDPLRKQQLLHLRAGQAEQGVRLLRRPPRPGQGKAWQQQLLRGGLNLFACETLTPSII